MTELELISKKPPEYQAAYWQTVAEERITPGVACLCIVASWVLGAVFGFFMFYREAFQ